MDGPIFYLIKEASDMTGVNAHTIRFWEKSFPEFLSPKRSGDKNKQRLYSLDEIEMIKRIKQLVQSEKNSIERAREIMRITEFGLSPSSPEAGDGGQESMAVTAAAQTPGKIIKNILDEIKHLKEEYKNDFETVYEGLSLIIEQTSGKKETEEVKELKEHMEHLEALVRQNLKSSVSAEAEKQEILSSMEDLKFKQMKDSEEKIKIINALKKSIEDKNVFQRILWIIGVGIVSIASAVVVVLNWIR